MCVQESFYLYRTVFKIQLLGFLFGVQESFYLYGTVLKIQFFFGFFFFLVFGFLREFCQTFKAQVIQSIVGARFILLAMYLIKKFFLINQMVILY